jgi:hypothetical protein
MQAPVSAAAISGALSPVPIRVRGDGQSALDRAARSVLRVARASSSRGSSTDDRDAGEVALA